MILIFHADLVKMQFMQFTVIYLTCLHTIIKVIDFLVCMLSA